MTIEEEIFKRTKVDFDKLLRYGFKMDKSLYKYSKNIIDNSFRIDVEIDKNGIVSGKVYDLAFGDEYNNFRIENSGIFAYKIESHFRKLLEDIKSNCFVEEAFISKQANRIAKLIKEKYGDSPNFEWEKFPGYATFRNAESKKWYGIIMNIDKSKLGDDFSLEVEIIDIKLEPEEISDLLKKEGFYPAYHMNKKSWITIILDDTVDDQDIINLIDKSYSYTALGRNNSTREWIVPANPKYFDIEKALKESNVITWKQSTDIKVGDIVYLYVAQPYSSIMYKFKVLEVNIPYDYKDKNIKISRIMKIDLVTRYEKGKISFTKLKSFGINAIRGPRYMPLALSKYISEYMSE